MPGRRAVATATAVAALAAPAVAGFTAVARNGTGLPVATASLAPPTDLLATPGCTGLLQPSVVLSWTATASPYASGYVVRRRIPLGAWSTIATLSGRTTTGYTDSSGLLLKTAYEYVVQSSYRGWTADSAVVSVRTKSNC